MYDLSAITSEIQHRAPRMILLGVEKIGKSSFAAGAPEATFLPIQGEEGIDDILVNKTPVCASSGDVLGWLSAIGAGQGTSTVVIDSTSTLEPIINGEICSAANAPSINEGALAFGVGLDKSVAVWRRITESLDALRTNNGICSILVGHVKVKRFDDPGGASYDQWQWDVHPKVASLLYRWSDSILFCNKKTAVKTEQLGFSKDNTRNTAVDIRPGQHFLYTQGRPSHPGGGRGVYGRLPYEMELSWGHFAAAVAAQMKVQG